MRELELLVDAIVERLAGRVADLLDERAGTTGAPSGRHLGVDAVADLLAVDHKTIRAMIEHGDLPALRVGRVLRIDPADLARLRVTPRGAPAASGKRQRRSSSGEFSRLARLPYRDGDTKSGPAARQRPGPGNGGKSDA